MFYLNKRNNNAGFTLAEVLITLAIIGVVATMSIPGLIAKKEKLENMAALKKAFSSLSDVHGLLKQENGGTLEGAFSTHADLANAFAQKMNMAKYCSTAASGNCWHASNTIKSYTGDATTYFMGSAASFVLADGSMYYAVLNDENCLSAYGTPPVYRCGAIYVDLSGFKPPNTVGKDIFPFHVQKDIISPYGVINAASCPGTGEFAGVACTKDFLIGTDY